MHPPFLQRTIFLASEKRLEWRCNAISGERYQVEVAVPHSQLQPEPNQQLVYGQTGHVQGCVQPVLNTQLGPTQGLSELGYPAVQQFQSTEDFNYQLQQKVKGIAKLCQGGVTKKTDKTIDLACKGSENWSKK